MRHCLHVNPSETVDEVLHELGTLIREEIAATQVAIGCLRTVAHYALSELGAAEDQQDA
jgi:hypothetical protein